LSGARRMPWILLILAVVCEVFGTLSLKLSNGFSVPGPSIAVVAGYGLSFILLARVLKTMEVGVAYAAWSGLGTALVAIAGIFIFGESATLAKAVCITMIVGGVIGLHFFDAGASVSGANV